mgnify:CR=1 FL=1
MIPSRLAHIGMGLLVLGVITSNVHTVSFQKKLTPGTETEIGALRITFTGYTENREPYLTFILKSGSSTTVAKTAYYFDEKTESIYREPHIIPGIMEDIYIVPEHYESGIESVTSLVLQKGEERTFSGLTIRFAGFRTEHMTSGEPTIYADLAVNGTPVSPGIKYAAAGVQSLDRAVPGTDRSVALRQIEATTKKILLHVSPGKNTPVPADTVIVTVNRKRLIWLVWLGTVLIAVGGGVAFARSVKRKA